MVGSEAQTVVSYTGYPKTAVEACIRLLVLTIPLTSPHRSVSLDFDNIAIGTSWTQIFRVAPPNGLSTEPCACNLVSFALLQFRYIIGRGMYCVSCLSEEVLPEMPMGLWSTSCGSNRERKVVIGPLVS